MNDQADDRTWLCSVLFADIIDYSSQPVQTQSKWKLFFNHALAGALSPVVPADRVVLDTGDGAAVCFLADPESALRTGMRLQAELLGNAEAAGQLIRLGINLGPVKLVHDVNGNLNVIGDGINVGQRIMGFAAPNQILVSRSYFEVIGWLSEEHYRMFRPEGTRLDKHAREHIVYSVLCGSSLPATQGVTARAAEFSQAATDIIKESLSSFVGPAASVLVEAASSRAKNLQELCITLADTALAANERAAFLKVCAHRLEPFSPPTQEPAPKKPEAPPTSTAWDKDFLDRLQRDLAGIVGPIAKIVVARAANQARSKEELCQLASEAIASDADRKAFLEANR